jgi:hypothetical protein
MQKVEGSSPFSRFFALCPMGDIPTAVLGAWSRLLAMTPPKGMR